MVFGGVTRTAAPVVAAALLLVGCAGAGEDTSTGPSDAEATGAAVGDVEEVRVDGRRFATRCAGDEGGPSVMLVSGYDSEIGPAWDSVQSDIGSFARVCAYDRLGVGGSGRPPRSQTFDDMAEDLDGLVDELSLSRPVLLVAHSLGGMVAAAFAQQAREDVAGILLLDAPGPGFPQRVLERLPRRSGAAGGELRDGWEMLLDPSENAERLDGRRAFATGVSLVPIGSVPVLALTHSITDYPDSVRPRQAADLESAWQEGQNRWLAFSSEGRLERVDLAGHFIQNDRPDVVVEHVRELVAS